VRPVRAVEPPDPVPFLERARRDAAVDQFAQGERVAAGRAVQQPPGQPVEVTGQRMAEQPVDGVGRQRRQVEAARVPVLPEGDHRVRNRLAAAGGQHQEREPLGGQVPDHRGRPVVEQVRVVDADRDLVPAAPTGEVAGHRPQHAQRAGAVRAPAGR
jgi:hypothetical protein